MLRTHRLFLPIADQRDPAFSDPQPGQVFFGIQRAALPQGETLILKGVHRSGARGYVDLVLVDPARGADADALEIYKLSASQVEG